MTEPTRLTQPLFAGPQAKARDDMRLYHMVRAYDCIWTLLQQPADIAPEDAKHNAIVNLLSLRQLIEHALGASCFEPADTSQLEFDLITKD